MQNGFFATHSLDEQGRPTGGNARGLGFSIAWQDGPLGRGAQRQAPNGAFVEDIIAVSIDKIAHYQAHFPCAENERALYHLHCALEALEARTRDREARQVEGTYQR